MILEKSVKNFLPNNLQNQTRWTSHDGQIIKVLYYSNKKVICIKKITQYVKNTVQNTHIQCINTVKIRVLPPLVYNTLVYNPLKMATNFIITPSKSNA